MNSACIVIRRRALSYFASSGIVALFAVTAIATSAWHPKLAVAQVEAIPSVGTAKTEASGPVDDAGSVPDASTVFASSGAVRAPEVDAPTF